MIQLLPVTEPEALERLNRMYRKNAGYAYVCVEKREVKASCLFDLSADTCRVQNVSTVERDIYDGLVRAVFAFAQERGIDRAEFDPSMDGGMLRSLGFVQDERFIVKSLTNFTNHCGGCKKPAD